MFNTLKYARILEMAGVGRVQAEAHVQMIAEIIEVDMATKQDLKELEYRLTIKLGAIVVTVVSLGIAITAALAKFL